MPRGRRGAWVGCGLCEGLARRRHCRQMSRERSGPRPHARASHCCRKVAESLQDRHCGERDQLFVAAGFDYRAAGRKRRRKDHDHRDDHGAGDADLRPRQRARHRYVGRSPSRAASDEFRKSLCRHADAADGRSEPEGLRPALRCFRSRHAHPRSRRAARSCRSARPADRKTVGGPEDPRVARKIPAQPAGGAAARRADRFARSRHRRLGAHAP
jgi:hypothetical protein